MTSKDESKPENFTKDGKSSLSLIPCDKRFANGIVLLLPPACTTNFVREDVLRELPVN